MLPVFHSYSGIFHDMTLATPVDISWHSSSTSSACSVVSVMGSVRSASLSLIFWCSSGSTEKFLVGQVLQQWVMTKLLVQTDVSPRNTMLSQNTLYLKSTPTYHFIINTCIMLINKITQSANHVDVWRLEMSCGVLSSALHQIPD